MLVPAAIYLALSIAGRRRARLGHPDGDRHRVRRRLHGGARAARAERAARDAPLARDRRRHRRDPRHRDRLLGRARLGSRSSRRARASALVVGLARLGVRSVLVYVIVGALVWFAFHASGVHATIAGVILGLLTPLEPWVEHAAARRRMPEGGGRGGTAGRAHARRSRRARASRRSSASSARSTRGSGSSSCRSSRSRTPACALDAGAFGDPVALAVGPRARRRQAARASSLLSWIAVRAGLARLPEGVGWREVAGARRARGHRLHDGALRSSRSRRSSSPPTPRSVCSRARRSESSTRRSAFRSRASRICARASG